MSHSDVVPAVAADWSHPPFAAEIADGMLYGRGVLDTKGLGILELTTLLLLHRQGLTPRDEILLLIEPDEEEGSRGIEGMLEQHADLFRNVRMVLNEGGSGTRDLLKPGQVDLLRADGGEGQGLDEAHRARRYRARSVPLPNNAVVTMVRALDRIASYETPLRPSQTVVDLFAPCAASSRSRTPLSCATSIAPSSNGCSAGSSRSGRRSMPCCARRSRSPVCTAATRPMSSLRRSRRRSTAASPWAIAARR